MVVTWVLVVAAAILTIAVFAPVAAAIWAAERVLPPDTPAYGLLAAGLAALVALLQVPFLGPLVGLAVTIVGAGAWVATVMKPRVPTAAAPRSMAPPEGAV